MIWRFRMAKAGLLILRRTGGFHFFKVDQLFSLFIEVSLQRLSYCGCCSFWSHHLIDFQEVPEKNLNPNGKLLVLVVYLSHPL
jgi:hypothetical protein